MKGTKKDVERLISSHIRSVVEYEPIDPPEVLARRLGLPVEKLVKLDGNENPYGPSPKVLEALAGYSLHSYYPDPLQRRVREALAAYTGSEPGQIVAGSGCDELIDLVLRLFIEPGDKVIDCPPTFGMYSFSTRICGGQLVPVSRGREFQIDVGAALGVVDATTKVIFICSPNNPTGNLTMEADVIQLLETGAVVVVDETYYEFCGFTVSHLVASYDNLVVLRSLSKWAGLAGLRIGYGVMSPRLVNRLLAIKQPYNVNVAAEAALLASLDDTDLLLHRVRLLVEERERMAKIVGGFPGVKVWPSKGNFFLCQFPRGRAKVIHQKLQQEGIFVRYFEKERLKDCLRISAGKPEHTDALGSALKKIQEG